jgi:hypothetical protein
MADDRKANSSTATLPPNVRREAARDYRKRGWKPVLIPKGEKRPVETEWQWRDFSDNKFTRWSNIGVQLGKPSNGLCDIDLDCREARELAPHFLPETGAVFGRKSARGAHWLYICDAWKTASRAVTSYDDPELSPSAEHGACMFEWRTGSINKKTGKVRGALSMFPPSRHPSGERVRWDSDGEPAQVKANELEGYLALLAVAVLLARHWPPDGKRHEAALVIGGVLARISMTADDIKHFVECVARVAGDDEWEERGQSAAAAVERLEHGEPTTGYPRMSELWGEKIAHRVGEWLTVWNRQDSKSTPVTKSTTKAVTLPYNAPLVAADEYVKRHAMQDKVQLLRAYRGAFYRWTGTHWREYADEKLAAALYKFLNKALVESKKGEVSPFNPTKSKVDNVAHALRHSLLVSRDRDTPCWLSGKKGHPRDLVACRNGILNLKTRELLPHDPRFFSMHCMPLDYDPDAPKPKRWRKFLEELWPTTGVDDKTCEANKMAQQCLMEIMGYLITPDTSQQKIFLIVGPKRSGKGTIIWVLGKLLGHKSVVATTLKSMTGEFGRWP